MLRTLSARRIGEARVGHARGSERVRRSRLFCRSELPSRNSRRRRGCARCMSCLLCSRCVPLLMGAPPSFCFLGERGKVNTCLPLEGRDAHRMQRAVTASAKRYDEPGVGLPRSASAANVCVLRSVLVPRRSPQTTHGAGARLHELDAISAAVCALELRLPPLRIARLHTPPSLDPRRSRGGSGTPNWLAGLHANHTPSSCAYSPGLSSGDPV
jgi:hypothetical protein